MKICVVLFVVERNVRDFQWKYFDDMVSNVNDERLFVVVDNYDDADDDEIFFDKMKTEEEDRMNQLYAFRYPIDKHLEEEFSNEMNIRSYRNDH
jgi:hypothetical protein